MVDGGWECGYMVLQHMFDFVNLYQNQFPDEMWHDTREATDNEIVVLLMTLMPKFFSELGLSPNWMSIFLFECVLFWFDLKMFHWF
ncbi:hypothetical protein Hdeb2414_s0339g00871871 [Helianthus debilis subsp. tardiflorus]